MPYEIDIRDSALEDLDLARRWISRRSPSRAESWLNGARAAIEALRSFPRRCPLAPENDAFDLEIRQSLYGEYRILFNVEGDVVRVVHVQHGARRSLTPDELE